MTNDFRALRADLLRELDHASAWDYQQALKDQAHAALAEPEPEGPTDEELLAMRSWSSHGPTFDSDLVDFARAVLARWCRPTPQPPAAGEVAAALIELRSTVMGLGQMGMHVAAKRVERAADLLQRQHPQPVAVSERLPGVIEQALIKSECALSDIAEGEAEENEGDPLQWAEKRAADALARIRPVMREHGILTSEWPPLPANAFPHPRAQCPVVRTTNDLSPAAEAVFNAAWADTGIILGDHEGTLCAQLAAALRAAAQFNPGPFVPDLFGEGWDAAMGELRNIAAELDGAQ